jgi:hypothetical protein
LKRIKAFTIVEIGIAMLLSAVLILMCYKAYDIINKEIFSISSKANNNLEEITLRKLIANDVLKANRVETTSNGFSCVDTSFVVNYIFEDSLVIRNYSHSDTFKYVKLESTFWDDTNRVLISGVIVNKFELVLEKNGKQLRIVQGKNTASEAYMNL